jgi:hypothetical protein
MLTNYNKQPNRDVFSKILEIEQNLKVVKVAQMQAKHRKTLQAISEDPVRANIP